MDDATRSRAPAEGNSRMLRLLAQSRQGTPRPDVGDAAPAAGPEPDSLDGVQLAHQPATDAKG